MLKIRLVVGLAAAVGAFAMAVTPAFAEFTSHNKSTEGKLTAFAVTLEGVGATIDCGALESGPSWQIKNKGTLAEKGASLDLKFKSLGECLVTYKEGEKSREVKATSGECEWEVSEPKTEMAVDVTDVTTCTIKPELTKSCEVKIEAKENKSRESATLFYSGETDENLGLNLELSKVAATATGAGCETAGIKSTSAATLNGAVEVQQVAPGMAAPKFKMHYATSNTMTAVGQKRTGFVVNESGVTAPPEQAGVSKLLANGSTSLVKISNKTVAECASTVLNNGASCQMELTLEHRTQGIKSIYLQFWEGTTVGSEVIFFVNA